MMKAGDMMIMAPGTPHYQIQGRGHAADPLHGPWCGLHQPGGRSANKAAAAKKDEPKKDAEEVAVMEPMARGDFHA